MQLARLQCPGCALAILRNHVGHELLEAAHELRACALGCSGAERRVRGVLNDELGELSCRQSERALNYQQSRFETADTRTGGVQIAVYYNSGRFGDDFGGT